MDEREKAFNQAVVDGAKLEIEQGPMTALKNMFDAGARFASARSRQALEHYADEANWGDGYVHTGDWMDGYQPDGAHGYDIARAALGAMGNLP